MPITNVTAAPGPAAGVPAPGTRDPKSSLGKDDFLKLIAGQLKHQDPMGGGKGGEEMMAQMTQFAMLEQLQNLAADQKLATAAATATSANSLIGKTVTLDAGDGTSSEALVQSVVFQDGAPMLRVAGQEDPIAMAAVVEVK